MDDDDDVSGVRGDNERMKLFGQSARADGAANGPGRVRTAAMEQLRILLQAFDEGLITASEYKEHKQIVLCGVSQPARSAEQAAASASHCLSAAGASLGAACRSRDTLEEEASKKVVNAQSC